jgi:hypothetical protein
LDLDIGEKIFFAIFMNLEFSIRPVIPIRGLSLKGRKDFWDVFVFVEKCPRKRFNSHNKDRQK